MKEWICDFCGKVFQCSRKMRGHKSSHTRRPRGPSKETLAGTSVTAKRRLAAQQTTSHECKWCGKSFKFGHQLGGHIACCKLNPNCEKNLAIIQAANSLRKIPLEKRKKDTLYHYRMCCVFKFNLADYPEEFDFSLIEEHGWYSAKNRGNNLNGVSRDHIVSVKYGYQNNIDPNIISHPANCRLMLHGSNVSKGEKCGMTVEQLKEKIRQWDEKYLGQ